MQRNLDGVYFRVKKSNGDFDNICFSDLTEEQMKEVLQGKDTDWLISLCIQLGKTIHNIGEQFDLMVDYDDWK